VSALQPSDRAPGLLPGSALEIPDDAELGAYGRARRRHTRSAAASTLTVLCPTRDPGPQVRAALEPLREVADEILVAVDSRADTAELGEYAAIADRVIRFERGPTHSALTWLHAQCRGDWVFSIAGDEVPGEELVHALPDLVASRDALQHYVLTKWLWPAPDRWLSGIPWYPDFHPRLVRNDGTLRFRGRKHEHALPALPNRWSELTVWHLNLLLLSETERREKVEHNRAERPGLVAPGGRELNETYYLPEAAPAPATEPVPAGDLELIRRVLEAVPSGASAESQVPLGTRAEIEPLWAGRELDPDALDGTVEPLVRRLEPHPGEHRTIYLRVRNESAERWPWGLELPPLVRLGARWDPPARPEGRAGFTCDLSPGEESIVPLALIAPELRGDYRLEAGLLLEHVRWFGTPCVLEVTVR
jgi:hypothetical protein